MKKENAAIFDGANNIANLIYKIRGRQVMLGSDLARLYECRNGTKTINQAVRRHEDRFPEDFCFQINEAEFAHLRSQLGTANTVADDLRSQFSTANREQPVLQPQIGVANNDLQFQAEAATYHNMSRSKPYVFTEQGVAMLATVLRTGVASKVSIAIMRAFVEMKKYISTNLMEQNYINKLVISHDERLDLIERALSQFQEKRNHLFFDGQIYDAYSLLKEIFAKSKKEIVIVDNYMDKKLLDIVSKLEKDVIVATDKYNNYDYEKYKKQYHNVKLKIKNKIHDRFIIVDRKTLYHSGASFKDLGKKCFAINKIEDRDYLKSLIKYLELDESQSGSSGGF